MPVSHKGMPPTGPNGPYNDMSGAPVTMGSAVQDAGDPYARSYVNPYALYPSWSQQETPTRGSDYRKSNPDYQNDGARTGLTDQEFAWYGRRGHTDGPTRLNHYLTVNDKSEHVLWGDEGPVAQDLTPHSDGTQPTEPNNDSGRWRIPRILRAGIGYMFLRSDTPEQTVMEGLTADHISLADNVVILPIGGMASQLRKNMRNTYRIEPEPWDLNLVDKEYNPNDNAGAPASPQVPPNVNGTSYRLG